MGAQVFEMAHVGCSVQNLQNIIDFLKSVSGLNNIRTQFIDYPYLSGVVGIKNCAIDIGFATRDGDNLIELLDFRVKNEKEFSSGFLTVGSGFIAYTTEDIEAAKERCVRMGAEILLDMHQASGGPFNGKKSFFAKSNGVCLEFIEDTPARLSKVAYVVSDLAGSAKFFEALSLTCCETFDKMIGAIPYIASIFKHKKDGFFLELMEPQTKQYFDQEIRSDMTGNVHSCFFTDGIHELFNELCEKGAVPQGMPTYITHGVNAGAYSGYLTAPDGIKVELFQGKQTKI